jgi:hypothetical protein
MVARDLLGLVWSNLLRRKARVAMTAVGVVIGTAAVIVLISLGSGLQHSYAESLSSMGDLTRFGSAPDWSLVPSVEHRWAEPARKQC